MATVKELVDVVVEVTGEPWSRVNQIARTLIARGWLPKSQGRAISHVEANHILPLVAAVAFARRNTDAEKVAEKICNLPIEPEFVRVGKSGIGKDETYWISDPDTAAPPEIKSFFIQRLPEIVKEGMNLNEYFAAIINIDGDFEINIKEYYSSDYVAHIDFEIYLDESHDEEVDVTVWFLETPKSKCEYRNRAPAYKEQVFQAMGTRRFGALLKPEEHLDENTDLDREDRAEMVPLNYGVLEGGDG